MKYFKRFLQVASLGGAQKINELLLDCQDNIQVCCKSPDNAVGINVVLNSNPLGVKDKVGLTDVEKLLKYLDLVGEDVNIKVEKNKIVLKGTDKKATILLKDPQFMNELAVNPKKFATLATSTEGCLTVNVPSSVLKQIDTYFRVVKSKIVKIDINGNKMVLNVGEENSDNFTYENTIEGNGNKYSVCLSVPFVEAIQVLSGDITMQVNKEVGSPVLVRFEEENIKGTLLFGQHT